MPKRPLNTFNLFLGDQGTKIINSIPERSLRVSEYKQHSIEAKRYFMLDRLWTSITDFSQSMERDLAWNKKRNV